MGRQWGFYTFLQKAPQHCSSSIKMTPASFVMVLTGMLVLLVAEALLHGVCSPLCSQADSVELGERQTEETETCQTLTKKSRLSEAGMCRDSMLNAEGVYGKSTGNVCLVSTRSCWFSTRPWSRFWK